MDDTEARRQLVDAGQWDKGRIVSVSFLITLFDKDV